MPTSNCQQAPLQLEWVQMDGEVHHVSDYAGIPQKERPQARCPACGQRVVLRLGKRRRHHAAHHPGDTCPLQQPETLLHYNCKHHIARQLRGARHLWVQAPCVDCGQPVLKLWAKQWSDVRVEYRVREGLIPDVTLLRGEEPVAGIEVYVSHFVDENKATRLKVTGFPWVEVQGSRALYQGDTAWTPKRPLSVIRYSEDLVFRHLLCRFPAHEDAGHEPRVPPDSFSCVNTEVQEQETASVEEIEVVAADRASTTARYRRRSVTKTHTVPGQVAALAPRPSQPGTDGWAWEHEESEPQDRVFPGKQCVVCGNRGIAYASNSGPLCKECSSNSAIRGAADARRLTTELTEVRNTISCGQDEPTPSTDNGLLSPQG